MEQMGIALGDQSTNQLELVGVRCLILFGIKPDHMIIEFVLCCSYIAGDKINFWLVTLWFEVIFGHSVVIVDSGKAEDNN